MGQIIINVRYSTLARLVQHVHVTFHYEDIVQNICR